jgi:hypothetical protein
MISAGLDNASSQSNRSSGQIDSGKERPDVMHSHVPFLTWRPSLLGAFVSVGGIILAISQDSVQVFSISI